MRLVYTQSIVRKVMKEFYVKHALRVISGKDPMDAGNVQIKHLISYRL